MTENASFLRQLSRFNDDVRRYRETGSVAVCRQIVACADAECELRAAIHARETAPGLTAILTERIARAEAETQVGVLIASGDPRADFAKAWRDAEGIALPPPRNGARHIDSPHGNRLFSVARVCDNSYRFFTVSAGR
ncbi:MAG: hypothetical protein H7Y38_11685 [Armatimonadetes bacterium]|nr:hypothetical protein [Armatimonadota bacterium]